MAYNVELLGDARQEFIKLVEKRYYDLCVKKAVLSLSILQYMCDRVEKERGAEFITSDVVAVYFNAGTMLSDLISLTDSAEDEDEGGEGTGTATIDVTDFPSQLVDLACSLSDELPYFNMVKTDGEDGEVDVLCFFREDDTDIPEELKTIGMLIQSLREAVDRYSSGLHMTLGNYFADIQGTQVEQMNSFQFFSETGLGYLIAFLNNSLMTGGGNECAFSRDKKDAADVEDLVRVVNSFDGYTARVEDHEEEPGKILLTLTVDVDESTDDVDKVLDEALSQVNLSEKVESALTELKSAEAE